MICWLITQEIKVIEKHNVAAGRQSSEMPVEALNQYQSRAIDAAEIIEIVMHIKAQRERGKKTGFGEAGLAFCDALFSSAVAKEAVKDETMRQNAQDLTELVRNDAKTNWNVKETVRAKTHTHNKRLLLKHSFPPGQELAAINPVLLSTEVMAPVGMERT